MKKWIALCMLLAVIITGGILLAIDYDTVNDAWMGLLGAALCFAGAWWLTYYCRKHNLLPE